MIRMERKAKKDGEKKDDKNIMMKYDKYGERTGDKNGETRNEM